MIERLRRRINRDIYYLRAGSGAERAIRRAERLLRIVNRLAGL